MVLGFDFFSWEFDSSLLFPMLSIGLDFNFSITQILAIEIEKHSSQKEYLRSIIREG
jgi:hypothetical protein